MAFGLAPGDITVERREFDSKRVRIVQTVQ
jgi:hypothetical protein